MMYRAKCICPVSVCFDSKPVLSRADTESDTVGCKYQILLLISVQFYLKQSTPVPRNFNPKAAAARNNRCFIYKVAGIKWKPLGRKIPKVDPFRHCSKYFFPAADHYSEWTK